MLSSGKLCKYFFTQMSVTVLFLVIFEAESEVPEFQTIETFLIYQCVILVADLLFFLFRSGERLHFHSGAKEERLRNAINRHIRDEEWPTALLGDRPPVISEEEEARLRENA